MRGGDRQSVISRAFRVLDTFSDETGERTLEKIADRSGLSRSTAHRLAVQLTAVGALTRSPRGWRLGVRMFVLGQSVAREQRLRERALALHARPLRGDGGDRSARDS
jgi:DNA-binding IclR family transcriptional regulator